VAFAVDRLLDVDLHLAEDSRQTLAVSVEATRKLNSSFPIAAFAATVTFLLKDVNKTNVIQWVKKLVV
jgi:hypothetical protein